MSCSSLPCGTIKGESLVLGDVAVEQTRDGLGGGLVDQRPFEMGYKSMYILKDIVEGKTVDDSIYTGLDVCDNDNIDTYDQ